MRSLDLICDAPPNIETAPMGVGAEFQAEDWCTDAKDLVKSMVAWCGIRCFVIFLGGKRW